MFKKAKAIMDELALLPQDAECTVLENGVFEWNLPYSSDLNKDYWSGDRKFRGIKDNH
ncbi:hypothetical protein DSECCO2_256390 [anaerobic digester metagenome]